MERDAACAASEADAVARDGEHREALAAAHRRTDDQARILRAEVDAADRERHAQVVASGSMPTSVTA